MYIEIYLKMMNFIALCDNEMETKDHIFIKNVVMSLFWVFMSILKIELSPKPQFSISRKLYSNTEKFNIIKIL